MIKLHSLKSISPKIQHKQQDFISIFAKCLAGDQWKIALQGKTAVFVLRFLTASFVLFPSWWGWLLELPSRRLWFASLPSTQHQEEQMFALAPDLRERPEHALLKRCCVVAYVSNVAHRQPQNGSYGRWNEAANRSNLVVFQYVRVGWKDVRKNVLFLKDLQGVCTAKSEYVLNMTIWMGRRHGRWCSITMAGSNKIHSADIWPWYTLPCCVCACARVCE